MATECPSVLSASALHKIVHSEVQQPHKAMDPTVSKHSYRQGQDRSAMHLHRSAWNDGHELLRLDACGFVAVDHIYWCILVCALHMYVLCPSRFH